MNWSKTNKINLYYFLGFLMVIVLAYFLNSNLSLRTARKISESIFWLCMPCLFFSIICLFLKESVFKLWSKVTLFYIVFSVIIVLISPDSTHGMDIYPIIKENVTIVLAVLYSIISLVLVIYKSFQKEVEQN